MGARRVAHVADEGPEHLLLRLEISIERAESDACALGDMGDACVVKTAFAELGAIVVGISPDDAKSHAKFAEKQRLAFPLLADVDLKVCKKYGVWQLKKLYGREYMGVERSTFLIDEKGRLRKEWRKVRLKNHIEDIIQALKML